MYVYSAVQDADIARFDMIVYVIQQTTLVHDLVGSIVSHNRTERLP